MRFIKEIVFVFTLITVPVHAGKYDQAMAAGIAILAISMANSEPKCEVTHYTNYILGKKMEAAPATSMVDDKWNACTQKAFLLLDSWENTESYTIDIAKGQEVKYSQDADYYKIQVATTTITAMDKLSGKESEPLYALIDHNGVIIKADTPLSHIIGKQSFEVTDKITIIDKIFSQEIIYTGISGNEIHFQYREYRGNTIRWPFTMNLTFDLEKSSILKIKRYKLQILKASNSGITYKVL